MKNWVIETENIPAEITFSSGKVILENALVRREIETQGCKTVSFFNYQKNIEMIDTPKGDFWISLNGKNYSADAFDFSECRLVPCEERVPFKKSPTMTYAMHMMTELNMLVKQLLMRVLMSRFIHVIIKKFLHWSRLMRLLLPPHGRGINVKIYGVLDISRTIAFEPEQWSVPPGIKKWSCFLALHLFTYFSTSISPVS